MSDLPGFRRGLVWGICAGFIIGCFVSCAMRAPTKLEVRAALDARGRGDRTMKICQKHWDMLRAAIEARGLSHLGAKSAEQAMENTLAESKGEDAPFDPLMSCNFMIWGRGFEQGGLYLMTGDACPVCEAMKHTAHWPREGETEPVGEAWVERHWIEGPADAALATAREKGLVPATQ